MSICLVHCSKTQASKFVMKRKAGDQDGQGKAKKPRPIWKEPLDEVMSRANTTDHDGQSNMIHYLQSPNRTHQELFALSRWLNGHWRSRLADDLRLLTEDAFPHGRCVPIAFERGPGEEWYHGWALKVNGTKEVHILVDCNQWHHSNYINNLPIEKLVWFGPSTVPLPIQPRISTMVHGTNVVTGDIVWVDAVQNKNRKRAKITVLHRPLSAVLLGGIGFPEVIETRCVQIQPCSSVHKTLWGLHQVPLEKMRAVTRADLLSHLHDSTLSCINVSLRSLICDYMASAPSSCDESE
jgi:hypothetical protein